MLQLPQTISIIISYKCNANCDYCCFQSSPKENLVIDKETVYSIIKHAYEIIKPRVVVFTGGEPTLFLQTLLPSISFAKSLGLPSRIVTNGWWANSLSESNDYVSEFKNAGVCELNFTTGTEHQRFIPIIKIKNAISASLEQGIKPVIVLENDDNTDDIMHDLTHTFSDSLEDIQFSRIQKIFFMNKSNIEREDFEGNIKIKKCDSIMTALTFTPDNLVFPCCGLPIRKMNNFSICTLAEFLKSGSSDLVNFCYSYQVSCLFTKEPLSIINSANFRKPLDIISQHPCDLCYELYTKSDFFTNENTSNSKEYGEIASKLALTSFLLAKSNENV